MVVVVVVVVLKGVGCSGGEGGECGGDYVDGGEGGGRYLYKYKKYLNIQIYKYTNI